MTRILTVGMPTFDDWDGVFFTLNALRMYHAEVADKIEFIVVDNNPNGAHAKFNKKLVEQVANATYVAEGNWKGPWVKDLVIRNANTPYSLCMDSHVLLTPGSIAKLVTFYESLEAGTLDHIPAARQPGRDDLYHGPLIYDDLNTVSTHFDLVWRGQMWGIWATDERGKDPNGPPFEIPAQGMGLFTCRKEAWTSVGGFNRMMRGFGGEEGYIHNKFKQAGRTTWCLPFLRWLHRFDRATSQGYELTWENKVRNYYIAFLELGLDIEPIIKHFERWQTRAALEALLESTKREVLLEKARIASKPFIPQV